jgi:glycine hydroxymethyltransferase
MSEPFPARAHEQTLFSGSLAEADPEIAQAVGRELGRQRDEIELIASENIVSKAVLEAQGSVLTNKYAEGLPGRRYYGGCQFVDVVENLAVERVTRLFGCKFANVQPHSGASANLAAFMALMSPGDTFMGLSLSSGGHLTHGSQVNFSGRWFRPVPYGVRRDDHRIDMDEVAKLAREHRPKVIIVGGSAYPRILDFRAFRAVANEVGAKLMVDMAHFAGLVAGGAHPNPFPHAHVVTSTAHKTLRGPRSGFILSDDEAIAKKVNGAVFPGVQGGPLMHVIAAKAVAFGEALRTDFKLYARNVVANAKALAETLKSNGFDIVSGGTDTHLLLVDLRGKRLTGNIAEAALGRAHITCNKNSVPFDPEKPTVTSGIRLGTPAGTTRGFGVGEFQQVGELIAELLNALSHKRVEADAATEGAVRQKVKALVARFPIYQM